MDTAAVDSGSWLQNKQGIQDSSLPAAHPSCLRRPVPPRSLAVQAAYRDQDWTNPNRFSDPLHRSTHAANSLGFSLASRPNKAYTWYLENDLPWKRRAGSRSKASFNDRQHSLFATAGCTATPPLDDDGRRKRRNGASLTWERVRQQSHARAVHQQSNTLDAASTNVASGRLSPHLFAGRAGSTQLGTGHVLTYGGGSHLSSPRSSPCGSQRSCPSPHSLAGGHLAAGQKASAGCTQISCPSPQALGSHLTTSGSPCGSRRSSPTPHLLGSPCNSQRSSPSRSPQSTMARLSPSLLRHGNSPSTRLSPTQLLNAVSLGGTSPSLKSSRSAFVSQWVNSSAGSPSFRLSPCSAHSSQASSGRDDVSFGSETDDDFFYVSCQQLTKGLANLAVSSSRESLPRCAPGQRVLENQGFLPAGDGTYYMGEDDDDFDGCSDDALSDDVFLDNPQPMAVTRTAEGQPSGQLLDVTSQKGPEGKDSSGSPVENDGACDHGKERAAVESLRRNSLQSKLRRTWQHRRHKAATGDKSADATLVDATTDDRLLSDQAEAQSSSHQGEAAGKAKPPSTSDEEAPHGTSETKPRFYYVISPTDDVNMPDVIAVRRSSVELIRWQNSLRRRRRRQAKRHDLGRSRKKEPKQSGTV